MNICLNNSQMNKSQTYNLLRSLRLSDHTQI